MVRPAFGHAAALAAMALLTGVVPAAAQNNSTLANSNLLKPLFRQAVTPPPAPSPTPTPAAGTEKSRWQLEVAAGGGFAAVRGTTVLTEPTLICNTAETPQCTVDPNTVTLVRNHSYNWKPALSTGLIFRWRLSDCGDEDCIGIGIGGHFVFVPHGDSTRPAPAITAHIGKAAMQLFAGVIFVPTDEAVFPNGGDKMVVPASFNPSSLLQTDSGAGPSFFAGVVIGGVPIFKPTKSGG